MIRAERLARRAVSRTLDLLVDLPLRLATAPKAGAVSAFMDSGSIFQLEALRWFRTAVELAGIHPSDLIVSTPDADTEVARYLATNGVHVIEVSPFDSRSAHCNKIGSALAVASTAGLTGRIALTDTDIVFLADPRMIDVQPGQVAGKPVDYPHPPIDRLRSIFIEAGVAPPRLVYATHEPAETFATNLNGGLYLLVAGDLPWLAAAWRDRAVWLLARPDLLDRWSTYVDQIAFSLAAADVGLQPRTLPIAWNYPTHIPAAPGRGTPKVLHYHRSTAVDGLLAPTGIARADRAIRRANEAISRQWQAFFPNEAFWSYRYGSNPELGSGVGSRGNPLAAKREMISAVVGEMPVASTLDVGCGDGESTRGLELGRYTGVDLSPDALILAQSGRPDGTYGRSLTDVAISFELVLCLDVLIHQSDRIVYRELVDQLARRFSRALLISGFEAPPTSRAAMVHFHEPLSETIRSLDPALELYPVRREHEITTYLVLRSPSHRHPRDFRTARHRKDLQTHPLPIRLAAIQRTAWTSTRFYPDHAPRLLEYPLVSDALLARHRSGAQLLDVGAGVNPLVPYLTERGYIVDTLDPAQDRRAWPPQDDWNEWGFLDYGAVGLARRSYNDFLPSLRDAMPPYDATFSVSVIEHLPGNIRRDLLADMYRITTGNGSTILTVDVERGRTRLWNRHLGAQVESPEAHGDFADLSNEARAVGYRVDEARIIRDAGDDRVDIGWLVLTKALES